MKIKYFLINLLAILALGCSTEEEVPPPIADFDYTIISGGKVEFQNKSENADVFAWEFGDDNSSASYEENPTFTYLKAGTYDVYVKLYAGNGYTGVNNTITKKVSLVDVPPSINIDGEFEDWKDVPYVDNLVVSGTILNVKVDGSGDLINIYVEGTNELTFGIPSIFIDVDNNPSTGYIDIDWYKESGFEVLGEGIGGFNNFSGTSGTKDWSWSWVAEPGNWLILSEVVGIPGENKAIEMALPKSRLNSLTGGKLSDEGINIVLKDVTLGWQTIGQAPPIWENATPIPILF